jgi:hypothetical protein
MSDPARAIADAVLYEGYILWPYRRSATKNQQRWTFGGVFPPAHATRHPDDPATLQAQVVVGGTTDIHVRVRFLHVVARKLFDAGGNAVDELGGHLAWDEATEREIVAGPGRTPFDIPAGSVLEAADGGTIERIWQGLRGCIDVRHKDSRVTVRIENTTPWQGVERADALRHAFCSTHAVLHAEGGTFISATESDCENAGLWPVLIAPDTMLASPIILEDYPRIAPESPGDLFDGGEIDQLLVLNILALTDEEKAEMAASDARAREILERTEALTPDELMRLHGVVREFGMVR